MQDQMDWREGMKMYKCCDGDIYMILMVLFGLTLHTTHCLKTLWFPQQSSRNSQYISRDILIGRVLV